MILKNKTIASSNLGYIRFKNLFTNWITDNWLCFNMLTLNLVPSFRIIGFFIILHFDK